MVGDCPLLLISRRSGCVSPRELAHSRFKARCFSKKLWLCSVVAGDLVYIDCEFRKLLMIRGGKKIAGKSGQGVGYLEQMQSSLRANLGDLLEP